MPITRRHARRPVSKMHRLRTGGAVSLFNYNPSIAGGKIAIKRFGRRHRMGHVGRGAWQEKHLAQMVGAQAQGAGLYAPGNHARVGMGESVKDGRKRILEAMSNQFAKRMKH